MSLQFPLTCNTSSVSFVFSDSDIFKEDRPVALWSVPQFGSSYNSNSNAVSVILFLFQYLILKCQFLSLLRLLILIYWLRQYQLASWMGHLWNSLAWKGPSFIFCPQSPRRLWQMKLTATSFEVRRIKYGFSDLLIFLLIPVST